MSTQAIDIVELYGVSETTFNLHKILKMIDSDWQHADKCSYDKSSANPAVIISSLRLYYPAVFGKYKVVVPTADSVPAIWTMQQMGGYLLCAVSRNGVTYSFKLENNSLCMREIASTLYKATSPAYTSLQTLFVTMSKGKRRREDVNRMFLEEGNTSRTAHILFSKDTEITTRIANIPRMLMEWCIYGLLYLFLTLSSMDYLVSQGRKVSEKNSFFCKSFFIDQDDERFLEEEVKSHNVYPILTHSVNMDDVLWEAEEAVSLTTPPTEVAIKVIGERRDLFYQHGYSKNAVELLLSLMAEPVLDIKKVNRASDSGVLYFTKSMELADTEEESQAGYKVIPTGLHYKGSGHYLHALFFNNDGKWYGVVVGNMGFLLRKMKAKIPNETGHVLVDINFSVNGFTTADVLKYGKRQHLSDKFSFLPVRARLEGIHLLDKPDALQNIAEAEYAVSEMLTRITACRHDSRTNGFTDFDNGERCIFNTGNLGIDGLSYVYAYDPIVKMCNHLKCITLINADTAMTMLRCSSSELPKPMRMWNSPDSLLLRTGRFALKLTSDNMRHILDQRRERLPEALQSLSDTTILDSIQVSLQLGLQRVSADPFYAAPIYFGEFDTIHHLLPLYLTSRRAGVPDATMTVTTNKFNYYVNTLFTVEMARSKTAIISKEMPSWLK